MHSFEIPVWFAEGVATYLSEKDQELPFDAYYPIKYAGFEDLEHPGGWENHLPDPYNPYTQSRAFVEFLIAGEGESVVPGIFAEMAQSSFESSFEKVTGTTQENYESKFFASFEQLSASWKHARLLEQQGKPEESLGIFLEIAETVPNLEAVNQQIANLYRELGDYDNTNLYRQNQLKLVNPENGAGLSGIYNHMTADFLFTEPSQALKHAQLGVDTAGEWERSWSEKVFAEVQELAYRIEAGKPLKGYRGVIEGERAVTAGMSSMEKANLIDIALARYPEDLSADRTALAELKGNLLKQANAEN